MKKTALTVTTRIPVELLGQILADPENVDLCHTLVSAVITAERIRRPDGAAATLDDSRLHPAQSPAADAMAADARQRAERARQRREARKQRAAARVKTLVQILSDKKPVAFTQLFGTGLFTPEQERSIDALLNPTVRTITKLSSDQLRAYFLPMLLRYGKMSATDLPANLRRHALTKN